MKRILCYGDSNTWGYAPEQQAGPVYTRYDESVRWPCVLQALLGEGYAVIEEGLNGRTTAVDDPLEPGKNGLTYLPVCLDTQAPLDLVIVMLGSNDLKRRFSFGAVETAKGTELLLKAIKANPCGRDEKGPKILLIAPPEVAPLFPDFDADYCKRESRALPGLLEEVAAHFGAAYLNSGEVATVSLIDRLHLTPESHKALGQAVFEAIRKLNL